jgi:hypothetical protein
VVVASLARLLPIRICCLAVGGRKLACASCGLALAAEAVKIGPVDGHAVGGFELSDKRVDCQPMTDSTVCSSCAALTAVRSVDFLRVLACMRAGLS